MSYSLEEIKRDIRDMDCRQFYLQHIVRSDNWYFEKILNYSPTDISKISDDFRMTISESMGISFNSIMIVGSGKIGYSLSPKEKMLAPFCVDEKGGRKVSDIDVAIISSDLFTEFWKLFRTSYSSKYSSTYQKIYNEIYRGYINEKNIQEVDLCRQKWLPISAESKKMLADKLFIRHEITYRIYRSWEDFEEYNLKNIQKLKNKLSEVEYGTV